MSRTASRWSDLATRVGSALVLVLAGLGAVIAGGLVFAAFVSALCGAMTWELARMQAPRDRSLAVQTGVLAGAALLLSLFAPVILVLPLLLTPGLLGALRMRRQRLLFCGAATLIVLGGFGMIWLRTGLGIQTILYLIAVVVATDIAGYFGGKLLGGPKFWPRISPNKTWAGTASGWLAAALTAAGFGLYDGSLGWVLVALAVALSMAAQAGDIAESAIKRRAGVKDSSSLIPGHGGFLDRFDGMIGASLFALLIGFTALAMLSGPG